MQDSKNRFSDRAHEYKKFRPKYPLTAIEFVKNQLMITENWQIADIGSGTGISSNALLDVFKCPVYAVEPNDNMRQESQNELGSNPFFISINGSSEKTNLQTNSIDLVAAFQAFHWFDKVLAKNEFLRISKKPHHVLLVWNDRKTNDSPFLEGYDKILKELPDYNNSNHTSTDMDLELFFGNKDFTITEFSNSQKLDFDGLLGRFFSASYTPKYGTDEYNRQIKKLEKLFDLTSQNGVVEFFYCTRVYLGTMS